MMEVLIACLVTIMFLISGINKINNFTGVRKSIQKKFIVSTLPLFFYQIILILVILLEILGPLVIIYSSITYTLEIYAEIACYALVVFTILATLMYHPPNKKKEYHYFMKNVSIVGGLLALSEFYKKSSEDGMLLK